VLVFGRDRCAKLGEPGDLGDWVVGGQVQVHAVLDHLGFRDKLEEQQEAMAGITDVMMNSYAMESASMETFTSPSGL